MKDVNRQAAEQVEGLERRAALVEVVDVGQQAGIGVTAGEGDVGGLSEGRQRLGEAPHLNLGYDAHLVAQVLGSAEAIGQDVEAHTFLVGDARGRRGYPGSAKLPYQVHAPAAFFKAFLVDGQGRRPPSRRSQWRCRRSGPCPGSASARSGSEPPAFTYSSISRIQGSIAS